MAEDTENHTVRLLQEMHKEMREGFTLVGKHIGDLKVGQLELMRVVSANVELAGVHTRRMTDLEDRLNRVETRLELIDAPREH